MTEGASGGKVSVMLRTVGAVLLAFGFVASGCSESTEDLGPGEPAQGSCEPRLNPDALRLQVIAPARRTVTLESANGEPCVLVAASWEGTDRAATLDSMLPLRVEGKAAAQLSVTIGPGPIEGRFRLEFEDGATASLRLSNAEKMAVTRLDLTPDRVDVGRVEGCGTIAWELTASNGGTTLVQAVSVDGYRGTGLSYRSDSLDALSAGASETLGLEVYPDRFGELEGDFVIGWTVGSQRFEDRLPFTVLVAPRPRVERFTEPEANPLDLLIVVDHRSLVPEERDAYLANVRTMLEIAAAWPDLEVGVVPTRGGSELGWLSASSQHPVVIRASEPAWREEVMDNVRVALAVDLGLAKGIDASLLAFNPILARRNQGFGTRGAPIAIAYASQNPDASETSVLDARQEIADLGAISWAATAATSPCRGETGAATANGRYGAVAGDSNTIDICRSGWGAHFAGLASLRPERWPGRYALPSQPQPSSLRVFLEGVEIVRGGEPGFRFDPGMNELRVDPVPSPGAQLRVEYFEATCR